MSTPELTARLPFSVPEALEHLRGADPVLAKLIEGTPYRLNLRTVEPYASLLSTILFQQLAGAAAAAIQKRFFSLYGDRPPTPQQLIETPDDRLRAAGLSRQKAGYMRDLAAHVADGSLDFDALPSLSDAEVIARITAVKGLGEWSAHMFLMFHLGRPDVMPAGDLGVRKGMRVAYGLPEAPTPARAREIGAPWAPYRSVGSWYMWRVVETVTLDA
jgi:DNA-3-methyladenine glycosylase II